MKKYFCVALFSSLLAVSAVAQNTTAAPAAKQNKPLPTNPAPVKKSSKAAANQVWVNGKIYHCPGTRYYGKTKNGEYMTEQEAIAAGATASYNKPCVQ